MTEAKNIAAEPQQSNVEKKQEERKEEKLFTQEELNQIVKKRVARYKEYDELVENYNKRVAEVEAREKAMTCKEYLIEKGYSAELMEIIDTNDVESFKNKADKANALTNREIYVAPLASHDYIGSNDDVPFGETKHTPKGYWATDPKYRY